MADTLQEALAQIFGHEGGFTQARTDRGNWTSGKIGVGYLKGTKFGVSAMSYPKLDIRNLTLDEAAAIYRRDFAARQDGRMVRDGETIGKVLASPDKLGLIQRYAAARMAFLRGLSTWRTFGKGWAARVAKVEAYSASMFLRAAGQTDAKVKAELDKQATEAEVSKGTAQTGATVSGGGAAGAGGSSVPAGDWAPQGLEWAFVAGGIALAVALVALMVYFLWRARWQGERQRAYRVLAASPRKELP
jgi:lysozyme family protein